MNAICLVVDRLHAGYVGAYGNSWIETSSFDRLASQAFLFDRVLVDSPELERLYRSYWHGWHPLCPPAPGTVPIFTPGTVPIFAPAKMGLSPLDPVARPSLAKELSAASVRTVLLTDEPQVSRHPLAADFDELIEIEPPCQAKPAAEIDKTHFARCFAQIIDWLESARGPFLLWCHLAGLGTTWDAPLQFRQRYCEPGDPPPPETADVPDRLLPADYDPDDLFGITQAYAGQVSLLDACLGAFLDFLDDRPSRTETLLTITSARGFPLGEHRRIGPCDGALFGETVAVPWLVQLPGGAGAAARSNALVEPSDLWATLREWHGAGSSMDSPTGQDILPLIGGDRENSSVPFRDRICVAGRDGRRAIRTPAWYLLDGAEAELFAKPDDRWEANNVASRCQDVVEELRRALADYEAVLSSNGRVAELPPLDGALLYGLE